MVNPWRGPPMPAARLPGDDQQADEQCDPPAGPDDSDPAIAQRPWPIGIKHADGSAKTNAAQRRPKDKPYRAGGGGTAFAWP